MIPLTYTQTIEQESLFRQIETLRAELTAIVLPLSVERILRWNNTVETILSTCALSHILATRHQIEQTIQMRQTRSQPLPFQRYWNVLGLVNEEWVGTENFKDKEKYIELFSLLDIHKALDKPSYAELLQTITHGIDYISSGNEHPIVQTAILSAILFTSDIDKHHATTYATLIAYGLFATHGYSCFGRINPITQWEHESDSLYKAIDSIQRTDTLNLWILFVSLALKTSLQTAIAQANSQVQPYKGSITTPYKTLTARQKSLLQLLEKPGSTINNSQVQRQFAVSQISASRDLRRLTNLGLLSSFGKSRSISYSRIG